MPEELQQWLPREEILSYEEILRVVRAGAGLGIRKIRVTGGEPLTRRDVLTFFRELRDVPGIEDIGISTNGTLLASPPPEEKGSGVTTAQRLVEYGVRTANISLDTLDPALYAAVTGRDYHAKVMAGVDAALAAGFEKVKFNCVLMKDRSEPELADLVDFAHEKGGLLRFIELMPVSTRDMLTASNFLSAGAAKKILEERFGQLIPRPGFRTNGPASYYEIPGRGQMVGFIGAMTNLHFCESCNKLRLTSDGKLRPCLGSHLEFDLRAALRAGADEAELQRLILQVVERKPKEHDFRTTYEPGRRMVAIGG